jgi:hypothetical protein
VAGRIIRIGFLLDIFEPGLYTWILKRRIKQYEEAYENSLWRHPCVLLIVNNDSTAKRLLRIAKETYNPKFYIAKQEDLLNSNDPKIWIEVDESYDDIAKVASAKIKNR